MTPSRHCAVGWLIVFTFTPAALAQERPAPFYALAAEGVWVEYEWTAAGAGGRERAGTLRLAVVRREQSRGRPLCWIEVRKEEKQDGYVQRRTRRLLVDEAAFARGAPFADAVLAVFEQAGPGGAVARLAGGRARDFLGMSLRDGGARLETVGAEEVACGLGKFRARHVAAPPPSGRGPEYHAWLAPEVPFGWARLEVRQGAAGRVLFHAAAARQGTGAAPQN
jgi:hypothetical protein